MRPIPILTALLTVVVLFMMVFQRETLREFVGTSTPEMAEETNEPVPEADQDLISVIAVRSAAQEIDSAVVLRGQTRAEREVSLLAETSGRVISSPITKGESVAEGDLLCALDPGTKEEALTQAKASLAEAEQNLTAAESLSQDGFAAQTRVMSARSAREAAQAAVAQAERALADTQITAPFAGILESDTAEIGTLLQPGAACATIVQLDPIKLVGSISEVDVNRIALGARAGARLSTGEEVVGRVTFIGRSADEVTRTFLVEAEVPNPVLMIRDGQTADILIESDGRSAHLLPQSSLTLNDAGVLGVRVVDEDDITRFAPVELVRDSSDGVWLAGLPEEAAVIVVGQDYVVEGVKVDVTYREPGL